MAKSDILSIAEKVKKRVIELLTEKPKLHGWIRFNFVEGKLSKKRNIYINEDEE